MDGQLKKGVLELCVLFQISKENMYGYEIMKAIKSQFPDVHEAVIYAILRRINTSGYSATYVGDNSNGPQRKYYKITPLGLDYLTKNIDEWKSILSAVNMLGIK